MNYYASEHALTKHTKALWENRPQEVVYPVRDRDQFQHGRSKVVRFAVVKQNNNIAY